MQKGKETAANIAASAKAGKDKTQATLQEKAEKMTRDPVKKEMAARKKEEKFYEAEREKEGMREAARGGHTGGVQLGHSGYSAEGPVEGVVGSQNPAGVNTGSGRTGVLDPDRDRDEDRPGVHHPRAGGGARTGHGSGAAY